MGHQNDWADIKLISMESIDMPASQAINKPLAFGAEEAPERLRVVSIAHKDKEAPKGRLVYVVSAEDFCELRDSLRSTSGMIKGLQETVELMAANQRFEQ